MAIITEDYVSFETAKLLKEKGFNVPCRSNYRSEYYKDPRPFYHNFPKDFNGKEYENLNSEWYSAPTQQMAMRWLREENGIFIEISVSIDLNGDYHYSYSILDQECKYIRKGLSLEWNYEDAVEAAIKACLENLI
jgi:hypothetical protein